jgi:hypothetical protein
MVSDLVALVVIAPARSVVYFGISGFRGWLVVLRRFGECCHGLDVGGMTRILVGSGS